MRVFLAMLALVGLLLSPAAASAAAQRCLHQDGGAMVMTMGAAPPSADGKASHHNCCDEHGKPAKHDNKACAQACATVCGVNVALPQAELGASLAAGGPVLEPVPAKAFHAHAPPGLKRPPRSIA